MLDKRLTGTGRIIAVLENGDIYQFNYSTEDGCLDFIERQRKVVRMNVKPNAEFEYDTGEKETVKINGKGPKVSEYHIDPELVDLLLEEKIIYYSTFSADLYELPREEAYDYEYHKNDYTRRHTKELNITWAKKWGVY